MGAAEAEIVGFDFGMEAAFEGGLGDGKKALGGAGAAGYGSSEELVGAAPVAQPEPIQLPEADARVWSALGGGVFGMDELAARAALPTRECLAAVTSLELRGMVECLVSGEVRRR